MPRSFCVSGVLFLACACALLSILSISLPYLKVVDITRTYLAGGASISTAESTYAISQIRFGIWAFCYEPMPYGNMICSNISHAYSMSIQGSESSSISIRSSYTYGLSIHPAAHVIAFFAFCFSLWTGRTMTLVASILSFLAAAITFVALGIDIALYAHVKHQMKMLSGVGDNTLTGPGFWLTFVSFILLLLAGCTIWFGRRMDHIRNTHSGRLHDDGQPIYALNLQDNRPRNPNGHYIPCTCKSCVERTDNILSEFNTDVQQQHNQVSANMARD